LARGAQTDRVLTSPGGSRLVELTGDVVEHGGGLLEPAERPQQRGGVAPLVRGDAGDGEPQLQRPHRVGG